MKLTGVNGMTGPSWPSWTCTECRTCHEANEPHDRDSLHYQISFRLEHGRLPTWTDAMSHCDPALRLIFRIILREVVLAKGLPIPPDLAGED